jgi:DNA-binding NtrC family response regulator
MNDKFEGLVEQFVLGNFYLEEAVEMLERSMIKLVINKTEGNQSEASKRLGIHRNTLKKKLLVYGLGNGRRKPTERQERSRRPKAGVA